MLFNTLQFGIFFFLAFLLYWFVFDKRLKVQNLFLVLASYVFYACWDWRFVFLLAFSTIFNYLLGSTIYNASSRRRKKISMVFCLCVNLAILGFFKYYNFFVDSFNQLLTDIGFNSHPTTLTIILPIGISFYTLHSLSYIFDIYNGKIKPTRNFIDYSLFVSFFPLLVAGPIERATHLLPQIARSRNFDYHKAVDGCKQILWGLFKKVVIADSCAKYVNIVFADYAEYNSFALILASILFAIQIYGDFSGYTDIALGTARLLGFELLQNFKFPYFAHNIAEFWRRWHISLTSWLRDYLYIPLGGSRGTMSTTIRNVLITFLISGFWHGANWTFVAWGASHALLLIAYMVYKSKWKTSEIVPQKGMLFDVRKALQIGATFAVVCFAWIFFRADSIALAFDYIARMCSMSIAGNRVGISYSVLALIVLCVVVEWLGRSDKYALARFAYNKNRLLRWTFYYFILFLIWQYSGNTEQFIYFRF